MLVPILILATLIPIVGAYRASVTRRGIVVTHVSLFSFGALFYWISPILLGESHLLESDPTLAIWYQFFESHTSPSRLIVYLAAVTAFYLAFCAGSWLGARVRIPHFPSEIFPFHPRYLVLILPLAVAAAASYAFLLRGQLFGGYAGIWNGDAGPRGTFTATVMLLLDLAFLHVVMHERPSGSRWWMNIYIVAFAVASVLLLSLGGRLYIASAILMAVVYQTQYVRALSGRTLLLLAGAGLVGSGLTGILRLGGSISLTGVAANVASEPLFTSFSLLQFLSRPHFEWWNAPRFLLGDLINLIPTAIFPGKAHYLLDPETFGYVVFSPLGALNSFFSLSINFGVIGSIVPLFALGFGLSILRRQPARLLRIIYSMLSAWLAFTFFRDPFAVSIIKNMLEFGVIIPLVVAASLHILTVAVGPRRFGMRPIADPRQPSQ